MRHCIYAIVVLLLLTTCGREREQKGNTSVSDNDLNNLDRFIPAFALAAQHTGVPGLTLDQYHEESKLREGPSYSDSATNAFFAEYQSIVHNMNNDIRSYLAMAPPLAWWDTVTYQRRWGIRYMEALMVYPPELTDEGTQVRRSFIARFFVFHGKVWFCDKMYDVSVREFYDKATETLFIHRLLKVPNLYEKKIGPGFRESQRKDVDYDRFTQLLLLTDWPSPKVYRVSSSDMQDTLAIISGYPEVRVDHQLLRAERNDSTFILSFNGKLIFKTNHAMKFHPAQNYFILMDVKTRLFGLYDNQTGLYIEPQYRWIDFFERMEPPYAGVITAEGDIRYLDMEGKIMP